jgi:hypothetical protein
MYVDWDTLNNYASYGLSFAVAYYLIYNYGYWKGALSERHKDCTE